MFPSGPVSGPADPGGAGDGGGNLTLAAAVEQELKTWQQDCASRSSKAQSHVEDSLESFWERTKAENSFLPVFLI